MSTINHLTVVKFTMHTMWWNHLAISINKHSKVGHLTDVSTSMLICGGILWVVCINLYVVKPIIGKIPMAETSLCISSAGDSNILTHMMKSL